MKATGLFQPLSIGNLHLKNRIAMAPMTRGRAGKKRIPNELMADYYYQRSSAGLLITEATVISKQGIGWIDSPGIFTDEMVEGWRKVTDKVKPIFQGIIVGNCGYTKETAEQSIVEGHADMIAFGRPFITNPDLPARFQNNWPVNPAEDMSLWYTSGAEGYTDYAAFESSSSV